MGFAKRIAAWIVFWVGITIVGVRGLVWVWSHAIHALQGPSRSAPMLWFLVALLASAATLPVLFISFRFMTWQVKQQLTKSLLLKLKSESEHVRENAAAALARRGHFDSAEAQGGVVDAFELESSHRVRLPLIRAICRFGDEFLKAAELARQGVEESRRSAALSKPEFPETYLKIIRQTVVPALAKGLYAREQEERDAAAAALRHIGTPEALEAIDRAALQPTEDSVEFTAFHPPKAIPELPHMLSVSIHPEGGLPEVEAQAAEFVEHLSGESLKRRTAGRATRISVGALITIRPECPDMAFRPQERTQHWQGTWLWKDFTFSPGLELAGTAVFVRVSILVHGIEVAHINCPIEVASRQSEATAGTVQANPVRHSSAMYQRIFVSYAHSDKEVIESYHLAQIALGNDVFRDSDSIRTGDNWKAALALAIDQADIFQLFWSANAAASENVRNEWECALHRTSTTGGFIRPVFWEKPLWPPPPPLAHLHFRFVGLLRSA